MKAGAEKEEEEEEEEQDEEEEEEEAEQEEEEEEEQAGSVLAATLHTVLKAADVLDEPGGLVDAVLGGRAQVLQVSLHLGVLGERHEQ